VPADKLYMIDKVVRMRSSHGRFGMDHSELLNFESELTNKQRDDHLNTLVYKSLPAYDESPLHEVLLKRLNV
jgi:hypothetical protein